jgi:hypothetical protein
MASASPETGVGRTLNISSSGVWFSSDNVLTSGMPVELSLTWPVLLNDVCPMKLMIYGCVVRSNDRGAAVAIERYEFRTQGSKNYQQPRFRRRSSCGTLAKSLPRAAPFGRGPGHLVPSRDRRGARFTT